MIHENLNTKKLPSERVEPCGIVDSDTLKNHAIFRNQLYFRTDFKHQKNSKLRGWTSKSTIRKSWSRPFDDESDLTKGPVSLAGFR